MSNTIDLHLASKSVLLLLVLYFTAGCASTSLIIRSDQSDAALIKIDPATGEQGQEMGRGEISLGAEQIRGSGYILKKDGFEGIYIIVPSASGDNLLNLKMQPLDSEVSKKLAQAQAEVENLRKTLAAEMEKSALAAETAERLLEQAAQAQHYVTLGSAANAQRAVEQIEAAAKGAEVPAYVDLIKAKAKLLSGDKGGAITALDAALRKRAGMAEAKRLRDVLQK
jgi:hypothetical protein